MEDLMPHNAHDCRQYVRSQAEMKIKLNIRYKWITYIFTFMYLSINKDLIVY